MELYLEITYIDSDGQARKTPHGALGKNNAETREMFEANRPFETDSETCDFLLDLKDGDESIIIDTICLNFDRVEYLTGGCVKTEEEYKEYDATHWANAQAVYESLKESA